MAVVYDITLSIKADGHEVFGLPLKKRITVDESTGLQKYDHAGGGAYVALNTSVLDEIQLLFLKTSLAATVRLDGQTDAGIVLNAGGLILIVDADIDAGAATNATLSNGNVAATALTVLGGGT